MVSKEASHSSRVFSNAESRADLSTRLDVAVAAEITQSFMHSAIARTCLLLFGSFT